MHARVRDCCWIRETISSLVKSSPEVDTGLDTVFQIRDKKWGMWLRNYGLLDDCDVGIVRSFFFCISLSVLPLVLRREIRYVVTRGANSSPVALTQYTERCPPRYGTGDLFLTPSDQWPLLFCVIYTRRTVCCKRSTATGTARRRGCRSAPFVGVTCLLLACRSQRRRVAGKRHGHVRARVRARETAFFFSQANDYDAPPTTLRIYARVFAKLSIAEHHTALSETGNKETKEEREREKESVYQ